MKHMLYCGRVRVHVGNFHEDRQCCISLLWIQPIVKNLMADARVITRPPIVETITPYDNMK
jgi:hypothetical protein